MLRLSESRETSMEEKDLETMKNEEDEDEIIEAMYINNPIVTPIPHHLSPYIASPSETSIALENSPASSIAINNQFILYSPHTMQKELDMDVVQEMDEVASSCALDIFRPLSIVNEDNTGSVIHLF